MEKYGYLAMLAFTLCGSIWLEVFLKVGVIRRFKRVILSILPTAAFFLIWDLFGIASGIFFRGNTHGLTGLMLAPELPLEELLFLTLLCYTTLEMFIALGRLAHSRRKAEVSE